MNGCFALLFLPSKLSSLCGCLNFIPFSFPIALCMTGSSVRLILVSSSSRNSCPKSPATSPTASAPDKHSTAHSKLAELPETDSGSPYSALQRTFVTPIPFLVSQRLRLRIGETGEEIILKGAKAYVFSFVISSSPLDISVLAFPA